MKITTALLADAARVEQGTLYVHRGGWDTIFTPVVPFHHPSMALVVILRTEYSEALADMPVIIDLRDADETVVPGTPSVKLNVRTGHSPLAVRGDPAFSPIAVTINSLQLPSYGQFHFSVRSAAEELATIPLRVAHPQGAVQPAVTPPSSPPSPPSPPSR